MLLVPASRLAVGARNGLALPVDQVATDGVVAIARRRRKLPARLVEREGQQIGLRVLCPVDTGLPRSNLRSFTNTKSGEDLDARVAGVHSQRNLEMTRQRRCDVCDAIAEAAHQREDFRTYLRVGPE